MAKNVKKKDDVDNLNYSASSYDITTAV